MSESATGEEPTPSEEELQAMMPTVLQLQKLIQERLQRSLRPREDRFSLSITSCDNHSCN